MYNANIYIFFNLNLLYKQNDSNLQFQSFISIYLPSSSGVPRKKGGGWVMDTTIFEYKFLPYLIMEFCDYLRKLLLRNNGLGMFSLLKNSCIYNPYPFPLATPPPAKHLSGPNKQLRGTLKISTRNNFFTPEWKMYQWVKKRGGEGGAHHTFS